MGLSHIPPSRCQDQILTEADQGVGAGNLGGGRDTWDTHGNNFNHLKHRMLPVFDRSVAALPQDLSDRGSIGQTLVEYGDRFRPHSAQQRQRWT